MDTQKEKALRAIENLVSTDEVQNWEWLLERERCKLTSREIRMAKLIGRIYEISHWGNGDCRNTHSSWKPTEDELIAL